MTVLALWGAGRIGRVHAANLRALAGVEIRYLVDPVEGAERDALARGIGARVVDAAEALADPAVEGVVIASPTDTHAALLLAAAAAGKAIFCEKPVSLDFPTVVAVANTVRDGGTRCMLGFQRRYDPDYRALRDRVASGESGRLEQLVSFTRDPAPPPVSYVARSGGLFRDQAIHDFDVARYVLGEEMATVSAVGACLIDPAIGDAGDVDTAMVTMVSESGRMVQMNNCRRSPLGYEQRLEALCAREVLNIGNTPRTALAIAGAAGLTVAPPEPSFVERFAHAYRLEMAAFVAMIREGVAPLAGIADGLEAQRLAEAAALSARRGGAPVLVAEIDAGATGGAGG